jgi:hypothetical protein
MRFMVLVYPAGFDKAGLRRDATYDRNRLK